VSGQLDLGLLSIVEYESPVDEPLLQYCESIFSEPRDDPVQGGIDLSGTASALRLEGRRKLQAETGPYSWRFTPRTAFSSKSASCED